MDADAGAALTEARYVAACWRADVHWPHGERGALPVRTAPRSARLTHRQHRAGRRWVPLLPDPGPVSPTLRVVRTPDPRLPRGKHSPRTVHCRGGIGPTGVVVGCWLVESGAVEDGSYMQIVVYVMKSGWRSPTSIRSMRSQTPVINDCWRTWLQTRALHNLPARRQARRAKENLYKQMATVVNRAAGALVTCLE